MRRRELKHPFRKKEFREFNKKEKSVAADFGCRADRERALAHPVERRERRVPVVVAAAGASGRKDRVLVHVVGDRDHVVLNTEPRERLQRLRRENKT